MKQGTQTGILNSVRNNEVLVRQLDKQINTEEHLSSASISNDEAIARELQSQINWEYNQKLRSLEKLQNGSSKLNISYEKYRKYDNYDNYREETFDDCDQQDSVDQFEAVDTTLNSILPCGYLLTTNGSVVTKHDISLDRQRNTKRMVGSPSNVQTANESASHIEIPNNVFNRLKVHSQIEWYHKNIHGKEKDEANQHKSQKNKKKLHGVDQTAIDTICSFYTGVEPCLKHLYGKIAEGKESTIYYAETAGNEIKQPRGCIVKIYKLDVHDFKLLEKNISGDYRYKDRYNLNMSKHKIMCLWAEKEMDNLMRIRKHRISCPVVLKLRKNVLVMSSIGDNNTPATKLQYAKMSNMAYRKAYEQVVQYMRRMYKNALLIHGDLSASNILWYRYKCYFIDVSQAVEPGHKFAFRYLKRDCNKVISFFKNKKLEDIMTREELFKYITGYDFDDNDGLELLRTSYKTYVDVT